MASKGEEPNVEEALNLHMNGLLGGAVAHAVEGNGDIDETLDKARVGVGDLAADSRHG